MRMGRGARMVRRRGGLRMWLAALAAAGLLVETATAAPLAPAQGRLLVARPELTDPNFSHAVVLLLEYSPAGALGVILNRPTGVTPHQLLPNMDALAGYDGPVYLGGPVGIDMLIVLLRGCGAQEDAQAVFADVCYSGSPDLLAQAARSGATPARLRLYVGYAGWAAGQLEVEIARGGWAVLPARTEQVFVENPHTLWQRLVPPPQPLETRAPAPWQPAGARVAAP
jgi:putative transcriptional regulator